MEFQKARVFTALNADELKIGSKVFVADNLATLKEYVDSERSMATIKHIANDSQEYRFIVQFDSDPNTCAWSFAYLVSVPEEKKLKWTDLKLGDIVHEKNKTQTCMVTIIDTSNEPDDEGDIRHVCFGDWWPSDDEVADWEKVE